jgi:predicted RNA-binding Zn-ribbon protein involved in translation (DUF1610 family)
MYRCPHCGKLSISTRAAALFRPPFDGRARCPVCGKQLRVKLTVFSFLLPMYLFSRGAIGLVFDFHFDFGLFWEVAIMAVLFFLQIRLIAYKEERSHGLQT